MISNVISWLNDPAHWRDSRVFTGIPTELLDHIRYSLIALAIAAAIALPLGLAIGHTGRGSFVVAGVNADRRAHV